MSSQRDQPYPDLVHELDSLAISSVPARAVNFHNPATAACRVCWELRTTGRCLVEEDEDERDDDLLCPHTKLRRWLRGSYPKLLYTDQLQPGDEYEEFRVWLRMVAFLAGDEYRHRMRWCLYTTAGAMDVTHVGWFLGNHVQILVVYMEAGSGARSGYVQAHAPEPSLLNNDDDAWAHVRLQRATCAADHVRCKPTEAPSLPPRLLTFVSGGLQLVNTDEMAQDTAYIALSYCWGDAVSMRTTMQNIVAHKRLIPHTEIPAVLRDLMTIARRMGVEYLWIDRLCIMQEHDVTLGRGNGAEDSSTTYVQNVVNQACLEDWEVHSQRMDKIYEQAALVVCAVTSKNVEQRFLGDVSAHQRKILSSFALPPTDANAPFPEPTMRLRNRDAVNRLDSQRDRPLDSRGWAFQERYLSTRCIRYEPMQILWECSTLVRGERYFGIDQERFDNVSRLRGKESLTIRDWYATIEEYSQRDLSRQSDKLHAISGMASRYSHALRQPYLAGLWQSTLLDGLLWVSYESRDARQHCIPSIPSWSWASLDLWTTYNKLVDYGEKHLTRTLARPVHISCEPATANAFGPVTDTSHIVLQGPTTNVMLYQPFSGSVDTRRQRTLPHPEMTNPTLPPFEDMFRYFDGNIAFEPATRDPASGAVLRPASWQRLTLAKGAPPRLNPQNAGAEVKLLVIRDIPEGRWVWSYIVLILSPHREVPDAWVRIGIATVDFVREEDYRLFLQRCVVEEVKMM